MATALRPIAHEDRLTLVDHLDELRHRLIITIIAVGIAFAICFWQSDRVLEIINRPVTTSQNLASDKTSKDPLQQTARFQRAVSAALVAQAQQSVQNARTYRALAGAKNVTARQRTALLATSAANAKAGALALEAAKATPTNLERKPVTLGVAEPFTSTISVAFYAGLLLSLPIVLYQLFAFLLPAFTPKERQIALPLMLLSPVLFILGVVFGYFIVLDRAVHFLQNFNSDQFDILLQAQSYYKFSVMFLVAIGLTFQIPLVVLLITRLGIVTPKQLRQKRGYVILGLAILAAVATPTPDPVTMLLSMAPLVVLFELSILLAAWLDRVRPVNPGGDDDLEPDDDLGDDTAHAL